MANSPLDELVVATEDRLAVLGQRRADGMPTLEWRMAVQSVLKDAHLTAAGVAKGGFENLDRSTLGVVGSRLRFQYDRLAILALDTAPGEFSAADMARLDMYAGAARGTFYDVSRRAAVDSGDAYCENILGDADHCDDCQAETDRGLVPADEMSLPGERQCLTRCACELAFHAAPVGEESAA